MRASVLAIVLAGCVTSDVVVCSNGLTCPAGSTCDEVRGGCLTDEQLRTCDGLEDGTTCTVELADDGVCDASVCVFATCGDNYRRPSEACDGPLFGDIDNCTQLGFYDDVPLACTDRCEVDQTVCTGFCGDLKVDPQHELCDGALPVASCVDLGLGAGQLECSDNCGPRFDKCIPFGTQRIDMPEVVRHIHGTSAANVWAVGDAGMVQRFDGTSWSAVDASACTTSQISRVFVLSATDAFILFSDGVGLITAAGCTKYLLDIGPSVVWAASTTDAYVGGQSGLVHLEQGTWVNVDSVKTDAVWGSSPSDVYAATDNGDVRHYNGTTWSAPAPIDGMTILFGIWGTGPDEVYIAGGDSTGAVLKRKAGASWTNELAQSPMFGSTSFATFGGVGGGRSYVLVADFTNAPTGVLLSGVDGHWVNLGVSDDVGVPFVTPDGTVYLAPSGSTKAIIRFTGTALVETPLAPRQVYSLAVLHEDEAYAVSPRFFAEGDLWAWDGATWTQEQTSNSREVLAVGGEVFAIINSRIQRRTGPSSWVDVIAVSGTTQLAGSSPTDLWVGGGGAQLQHWNGSILSPYAPPMTSVYDMWAASPSFAVASGATTTTSVMGTIAHWNGATWTTVTLPPGAGTVTRVWGRSAADVYAVSADLVVATDNLLHFDGTTWSLFPVQMPDTQILDLWGTGPSDLFAATNRGLMRFDGTRWTPVDSGTAHNITALAAAVDTLFICAGDGISQLVRTQSW